MNSTPDSRALSVPPGSESYLPPDNSIPVDDVLAMLRDPRWTWVRNNRCKYVRLEIDTRSMRCHLRDRDGEPITFKDLSRQCDEFLVPNTAISHAARDTGRSP